MGSSSTSESDSKPVGAGMAGAGMAGAVPLATYVIQKQANTFHAS